MYVCDCDIVLQSARLGEEGKMAMSKPSDATLEEDIKRRFCEWCRQLNRKTFSLLITGKTGTGKSSLVNALVGKPDAKEGRDKVHCTEKVTPYQICIENVKIRVWDSPGLQDGGAGNDERYLAEMKSKIPKQPDLVIFCFKMNDTRFRPEDEKAFSILTAHFGKKLWENAVIALTFANQVDHPRVSENSADKKAYFLEEAESWQTKITSFLSEEIKLDSTLIKSLPIVPTGYSQPYTILPDGGDWLSEFCMACFNAASGSAGICLYQINRDRLDFPGSERMAAVSGGSTVALVPKRAADALSARNRIHLNKKQQESFWKKMWAMFTSSVAVGVLAAVGIAVIKAVAK